MDLSNILAVSGLPGLFKMIGNRKNGLIVESLEDGKKKFVPARKHQFTPLESVAIYTITDTEELPVIFKSMLEQMADNPPVAPKSDKAELYNYFSKILPAYDQDRVYPNDIGKIIKWFTFLKDGGFFEAKKSEEEE
jgi:hypothetical protein